MNSRFSKKQLLVFGGRLRSGNSLFGLKFLFLLIACSVLFLLMSPSVESVENQENTEITEMSASSGGYSIFHETMVDMNWPDVEEAAEQGAIVLLPTAVIEEHGPHMSCGIDTYGAYLVCKLARRELESRGIKTLIAPPFYWGINSTTHVFPGTFTVRKETMKALLHDIMSSLKSWGFNDIFNLNFHGDGQHCITVLESIIDARETLGLNAYCVLSEMEIIRYGLSGNEPFVVTHMSPPSDEQPQEFLDIHAGADETGIVAAFFPDQVDTDLARILEPTRITYNEVVQWLTNARRVTPQGYLGDPADFDAEAAREYLQADCILIADSIEKQIMGK
ncbi:MAG: creatininase family protein [Sedimentisphaerales bacterium]|nr:creatininase family protein [Sedimentisphaerales bacterium]